MTVIRRGSLRYYACTSLFKGLGLVALLFLVGVIPAKAEAVLRIAVLGDSLTSGYGLPGKEAFPAQLEARLRASGARVEVANGGVSGDTSAGGRARLEWLLADGPDIVIVELGSNDALRGLEPESTEENLDWIVSRLTAEGVRVLLAGMLAPPNLGREYGEEFSAIYPSLATKHGLALYPFFLDGVAARPELNQADGIHPNAGGVAVIVERIAPYVHELIEETRRRTEENG